MKTPPPPKAILNDLLAKIIEKRDGKKCLKCGKLTPLHLSHIYPKGRHRRLEFEPDNLKFLCNSCHLFWWHRNPIEAKKWAEKVFEKMRLKRLDFIANKDRNTRSVDYKLIKIYLEQSLKKL